MVGSGCTGDDEVVRNVVAGSGAVKMAVIREEQTPPPKWVKSYQALMGPSRGCPRKTTHRYIINENEQRSDCVSRGVSKPVNKVKSRE